MLQELDWISENGSTDFFCGKVSGVGNFPSMRKIASFYALRLCGLCIAIKVVLYFYFSVLVMPERANGG